MEPITLHQCDDWWHFKETIKNFLYKDGVFRNGRYWFRGHSDWKHRLLSSFDRWFDQTCKEDDSRIELSKRLLEYFEREAEFFEDLQAVKREPDPLRLEARKLALAQHHGVPTRLLDWSESPYVAAFFAFEGVLFEQKSECVSVWALDTEHKVWKDERGVDKVTMPALGNARMRNQRGCFTLLRSPKRSLEEFVKEFSANEFRTPCLHHFIVPSLCAKDAFADLESMNITHSTIYPGLDGCAVAAKVRFVLSLP